METLAYGVYISIAPDIRFGRPCLTGTRIAVADVLGWLGNGQTMAEIIEDFPELSENQLRACLLYAADRERHLKLVLPQIAPNKGERLRR